MTSHIASTNQQNEIFFCPYCASEVVLNEQESVSNFGIDVYDCSNCGQMIYWNTEE